MYVCMYVCSDRYTSIYVRMFVCMYVVIDIRKKAWSIHDALCAYLPVDLCMLVCMYVHTYICR